ncbi:MAG: hypothetical protein AMJ60_08450 [Desulfobacterales bacterium SG8_35]|nr:MAG: hypothetical protein AMJ60_08450 [Desulfobacterales bacterium SG8_35]
MQIPGSAAAILVIFFRPLSSDAGENRKNICYNVSYFSMEIIVRGQTGVPVRQPLQGTTKGASLKTFQGRGYNYGKGSLAVQKFSL